MMSWDQSACIWSQRVWLHFFPAVSELRDMAHLFTRNVRSLQGRVQRMIASLTSHMQMNLMQKEDFHFNCINVNQWESAGLGLKLLLKSSDLYLVKKKKKKSILCLSLGTDFSMRIIINSLIVSLKSVEFILVFKVKPWLNFLSEFYITLYLQSFNSVSWSFSLFLLKSLPIDPPPPISQASAL